MRTEHPRDREAAKQKELPAEIDAALKNVLIEMAKMREIEARARELADRTRRLLRSVRQDAAR